MGRGELEHYLRWMMTLRVVIVTTLLVSTFAVEWLFAPAETLRPLFLLTAVSYGLVLLYAVADRWLKGTRTFTYLQLFGDILIITAFVHITGGIDSPMSFLYLMPIFVAALMLRRSGALIAASASFGAYTGLILFGAARALVEGGGGGTFAEQPGRVVYFLVAHLAALVACALLSAALTERLRLQRFEIVERRGAVARLKALTENIIESINSGLITTSPDGRINFINRGGTAIIGHGQEQVESRLISELLGLQPDFLNELRRRLLKERRIRFEKYYTTRAGRRIFLGVAVSDLFDKSGHPLGFIFIFQDLTEIHALEQEVRLRERMVALGEMATGMAHEIRNPLAAISGAVQYLKSDFQPQGESLELMDIILRESNRLDHAIRDFLMFTRPGSFAPERSDLVRLLEDNIKLLRKSHEMTARHEITTSFADRSMECEFDPNRLKQVFWNLAINALKAMPEGGTLAVEVAWSGDDRDVSIIFRDGGVGMDEAERRRYFQPFNSSFRDGTGLGAAIVYRIVEEHGGKIDLASEPAVGTRVEIRLPRSQGDPSREHSLRLAVGG